MAQNGVGVLLGIILYARTQKEDDTVECYGCWDVLSGNKIILQEVLYKYKYVLSSVHVRHCAVSWCNQ
jgi:hypothetical protein